MNRMLGGALFFTVLAPVVLLDGQRQEMAQAQTPTVEQTTSNSSLVGSWRIVSFKYGDAKQFTPWPKSEVMLKHVTPTHFTWVTHDAKTGVVSRMGGGTYTWNGSSYRENLQYGMGGDIKPLIGKPQTFTDKVTPTQWVHSGTLSQGLKIEEIWERVPQT